MRVLISKGASREGPRAAKINDAKAVKGEIIGGDKKNYELRTCRGPRKISSKGEEIGFGGIGTLVGFNVPMKILEK